MTLLSIKNLRVSFGSTVAVDGIDLEIQAGELLGIVGESGSGKSVSMLAVMGLIDAPGKASADEMRFDGIDLLRLAPAERRRLVGQSIAMVFQDPLNSLNPSYTVGAQIAETLKVHLGLRGAALEQRVLQLLDQVEIPDARRRRAAYPHQLSGGMNQRVMIAMAIACGPRLLIADEPTTALDVTIQAQVMALLLRLQREQGMSLVLITHDLAVVAEMAQRVCVMLAGKVVETASVPALFDAPQHAYTAALLAARPREKAAPARRLGAAPALQAQGLARHYRVGRGLLREPATVKALNGVSFTLQGGRTLAVVGESGCGKSTLARQLTLIEPPTAGELRIGGVDAAAADPTTRARLQQSVQMVFQNPYASLNPRKTVQAMLAEPLVIHTALQAAEQRERIAAMLHRVGLEPEHAQRYPHMFSGGQRQRIAIARAMMLNPAVVVADEPVSALDVSIQAQILNLFMDLQDTTGTAYVFISHNLEVVAHVAHDVMVMYFGAVVEMGPRAQVMGAPRHPYTLALRSATPALRAADRRQRVLLQGEMPSPLDPPSGCTFHTRCPLVQDRCRVEQPLLRELAGRHVACHVVT